MFVVLPDPSFMMEDATPLTHAAGHLLGAKRGQGLVSVGALVPKRTWGQMLTSSQPLEAISLSVCHLCVASAGISS